MNLREYVEKELEESHRGTKKISGRIFSQEDKLSRINGEIEKLERKIEGMLKEKKTFTTKALSGPFPSERLSEKQLETLRSLVHKKAKGNRKRIMKIWGEFKDEFGVTRYKHLSPDRFDEALGWVKGWRG